LWQDWEGRAALAWISPLLFYDGGLMRERCPISDTHLRAGTGS
jgi:hypothetical protein